MRFLLEIKMDNAAFDEDGGGPESELARIVRHELLPHIEEHGLEPGRQTPVRDVNGNYVGFWQVVA